MSQSHTTTSKHQSQRGYFAFELFKAMYKDENIYLLLGDLGYAVFDSHRVAYPDRVINCGASEQAMMDMAVGLAYEGKIPVVYSITPFLIYRPFETLRTYINHEKLDVKLIGSGRDKDYEHDGISHFADDVGKILLDLPNIKQFYPKERESITEEYVNDFLYNGKPSFISLRR